MVTAALVAGVVVTAVGHLTLGVLVVGLADTPRARLAGRLAVAVAVARRAAVTGRAVRPTRTLAVGATGVLVGAEQRLRLARVADRGGAAGGGVWRGGWRLAGW